MGRPSRRSSFLDDPDARFFAKRSSGAKAVEKPLRGNPKKRGSHSAWKSRKRRGISTFRTASTTTTLTIVITFCKMQPPASLRSED
ncbi:MAG: hypothetical protein DMG38_24960 [Acidobacteria bacterium]|nr:MAG: hypothetical protein DMG38_24960 [Acidobacteriota bacterium]